MMNFGNMFKGFFGNIFEGKFGQLPAEVCNISSYGTIAIKTNNGYKSFSSKQKKLVNVTKFAFEMGPGSFFLIPVKKVKEGDIVTEKQGQVTKFYAVTEPENEAHPNTIKMFDFETNNIVEKVPERHVLMSSSYYFGKVVSMWDMLFKGGIRGEDGQKGIWKFLAMQSCFGNKQGGFGFGANKETADKFLNMIMMNALTGGAVKDIFNGDVTTMLLMQNMFNGNAGGMDMTQYLMMTNLLKHTTQDSDGINNLFGGFFDGLNGNLFNFEEEEQEEVKQSN